MINRNHRGPLEALSTSLDPLCLKPFRLLRVSRFREAADIDLQRGYEDLTDI